MRKIALRGLLARKMRLALTALSIALGVTLIAGTFIFTDTITGSFRTIFSTTYKDIDVAVTRNTDLESDQGPTPIPQSVLDRVRAVDGVKAAEGTIFYAGLIARRPNGDKLSTSGFSAVTNAVPKPFDATEYTSGGPPTTDDEVAIPKSTAEKESLKVGDKLVLSALGPRKTYTISGIGQIAGVDSFGGGLIATFTTAEAQRLAGMKDGFNEIDVIGTGDVSQTELRDRVSQAVSSDRSLVTRTGDQQADESLKQMNSFLGILRNALFAFAGIALFVGAFLIFNTFSITVAQRAREIALLRVLGAQRRQVMRAVLGEGLVLGVIGSVIGLALGILTAMALRALFKAFGADLPGSGMVLEARTIIVSLLVGVFITVVACLAPAIKATRVPPLAALREGLDHAHGPSRRATIVATLISVVGAALLVFGLFGNGSTRATLSTVATGAALLFIGVALLSPWLVRPIARVVGIPLRAIGGLTGRLAQENATRNPGRTAVTSAALMIGVALVTFASVFASGIGHTVRDAVETGFRGQAVIQSDSSGVPLPVPPQALQTISDTPGVSTVTGLRYGTGENADKAKVSVLGIDPATFGSLYRVRWEKGDDAIFRNLRDDQAIISKSYAEDHKLGVGGTLALTGPGDRQGRFRVVGITDDRAGITGDVTVTSAVADSTFGARQDAFVMAAFDVPKDKQPAVLHAIDQRLQANFQGLEVQSNEQFVSQQEDQVNQLLSLIYGLLAMAIIVSLFGIVNTLVLSISERIRELGLLRAIGMSRRQIRQMVTFESIITALIGAVLGLVLGVALALLVTTTVPGFVVAIPVGTLIVLLVCAVIAGVLAAIIPAISASRINTLEALAYE